MLSFTTHASPHLYTLSLHDALPIFSRADNCSANGTCQCGAGPQCALGQGCNGGTCACDPDRKSTRLNSSHANISYAVFCLKKKKQVRAKADAGLTHCASFAEGSTGA